MKGIKYASYSQIPTERDVTGDGFSRGQINFKMQYHSMKRWNPYRSFIRMRIRLADAAGNILDSREGIAPNMFQGDCLWQQINAYCEGQIVSEIDDYVPQIASLRQRYSLPEGRRKDFLKDTNFAQSQFNERMNEVTADGFAKHSPPAFDFRELRQDDNTAILGTEELRVLVGNPNRIEYRQAADAGVGAIDLTESQLEVGDYICLRDVANDGVIARVTALAANTIDVDVALTPFGATDIAVNNFFFTKKRPIPSRRVKDYEICFRPCIGLFSIDDYLPGTWKIEMTPSTNLQYQKFAIESLADKTPIADYTFEIIDMKLYAWEGIMSSPRNGPESYNFTEIRCQGQTITDRSLLNKTFAVNKKAHTYTIAFQKPDAGDDTRYSKTKFRMLNNYEKRIQSYQLRINGETLPTPLPSIDTDPANNRDFATQQYYETLHYNNTIMLDEPESLQDWFERGPYYSYVMPKRKGAENTRVHISTEFKVAPPEPFTLLLFDHYHTGFVLQIENGIVKKCERDSMIN